MKITIEFDKDNIKKITDIVDSILFYLALAFICFLPVYFAVQETIELVPAILSLITIYVFFSIWDEYHKLNKKLKITEKLLNDKKKKK